MSIVKIDAGLFRIVHTAVSTEETRYYLNGVYIEPHADGGALLVATDGHRLLAAHDPLASCQESSIVQLPKEALALCKRPKTVDRRELVIDTQNAVATINNIKPADAGATEPVAEMIAAFQANVIDGTFPDWRRVTPTELLDKNAADSPAFNGLYLKAFGNLAMEIGKHSGLQTVAMRMSISDGHSPVVIRWSGQPNIFGVLMPMRDDVRGFLPAFMGAITPSAPEMQEAAE